MLSKWGPCAFSVGLRMWSGWVESTCWVGLRFLLWWNSPFLCSSTPVENPYDVSYQVGDHQGIAHMRMQVGQEEGMETMHEQGNVEDENAGCCVQIRRGCVKPEESLGPRVLQIWHNALCMEGNKTTWLHLNNFLPLVSLPVYFSPYQMSKWPNVCIIFSVVYYTHKWPYRCSCTANPFFYSITLCITLHFPSFPKWN